MTYPVTLLEGAEADVAEAARLYRGCHPTLELDFMLCVGEALARIECHPLAHTCIDGDFRRAMVRRFPFGIIYRLVGDRVVVAAVFHTSRRPQSWQGRDH